MAAKGEGSSPFDDCESCSLHGWLVADTSIEPHEYSWCQVNKADSA